MLPDGYYQVYDDDIRNLERSGDRVRQARDTNSIIYLYMRDRSLNVCEHDIVIKRGKEIYVVFFVSL